MNNTFENNILNIINILNKRIKVILLFSFILIISALTLIIFNQHLSFYFIILLILLYINDVVYLTFY